MLDRTSPKPLHLQMEELIRENLDSGLWSPGSLIPSENELSQLHGISRMTVRNVLTKLVQEDLLFRIPGKGTFVKEQKFEAKSLFYEGIREQLERKGYEVSTKLLGVHQSKRSKEYRKLNVEKGTPLYIVQRLRFVRGEPLSIHTSFIPVELAPGLEKLDLVDEQLCYILKNNYNLIRAKTLEELESVASTEEEAALLEIQPGHPLLLLQDTIVNDQDVPFEYAKVVFRGDKVKLKLEF